MRSTTQAFANNMQPSSRAFRSVVEGLGGSAPVLSLTKGLDPATGERLSTLVRGRPVAVLSGPNMAEEVVVMRRGRIEQRGNMRDLVRAPATDYVARLIERAKAGLEALVS